MKYKALMLDLDGTTIPNRKDGMPSIKVTTAIARAKEYVHVGIATGRPLRQVTPITTHLHLSGPIIILGGSEIIDIDKQKVLQKIPIKKGDMEQLVILLMPFNVTLWIEEQNQGLRYREDSLVKDPFNILIDNLSNEKADEIISIIKHIPTISIHKVVSWVKGQVCIDISHALATKQHAIYEVAKILHITPHEIIGVGDGYNDFPLLMACGLKIAMGNAVPELKAIADYIAPSVADDGVADIINKFILTTK